MYIFLSYKIKVHILLFLQAGISALRRLRKSDNNRIARACGATIVNRTDELKEEDVGTGAGLFEIKKVFFNLSIGQGQENSSSWFI